MKIIGISNCFIAVGIYSKIQALEYGIDFIVQRHKIMASYYEKVVMTRSIGEIKIIDVAIQPNKKNLIVIGFFVSLVFSLFFVFFLESFQGRKKEENL